jgi:hypothetical protein
LPEKFIPYSELKDIGDKLAEVLERDHFGVQYCLVLVGRKANGKSDTRLVSNIDKADLREHFLKILDDPDSIETEPVN